jgi:hypothetical protein
MFLYMRSSFIFWILGLLPGLTAPLPSTVRDFVRQVIPDGSTEYRGRILSGPDSYYLFILRQPARIGVIFIRQNLPGDLGIAGADTSLTSIKLPVDRGRQAAILNSARALLQDDKHSVGSPPSRLAADAQIGTALDHILFPISGFSLQTNGTLDILRRLQEANTFSFEPRKAPPGSILICPTRFGPAGPVELGHAGILAQDRCVYAADASRNGAWSRFGTLDQWLEKFGSGNRVYAFLLRASVPAQKPARLLLPQGY